MAALSGNFTLASNAADKFLTTVADDLCIYTDANTQRIFIGNNVGSNAANHHWLVQAVKRKRNAIRINGLETVYNILMIEIYLYLLSFYGGLHFIHIFPHIGILRLYFQ